MSRALGRDYTAITNKLFNRVTRSRSMGTDSDQSLSLPREALRCTHTAMGVMVTTQGSECRDVEWSKRVGERCAALPFVAGRSGPACVSGRSGYGNSTTIASRVGCNPSILGGVTTGYNSPVMTKCTHNANWGLPIECKEDRNRRLATEHSKNLCIQH